MLFTASFQASIALGAVLGGAVVDATSPSTLMVLGSGIALLVALVAAMSPNPAHVGEAA